MSNYTVDFSLEIPFDTCDLAEMEQVAKTAVSWCRRHMKLGDEFHLHEEDMQQTALLALYHHRLSSRPRAFSQAQYALMNYVLVSIWVGYHPLCQPVPGRAILRNPGRRLANWHPPG